MRISNINTPIAPTKASEISNYRDFCYPCNDQREMQSFNNGIRLYNYFPIVTNKDEVEESKARLNGRMGYTTCPTYMYKLVDIKFIKTFTYYNASYIDPPQINLHIIEYKGTNYIAVQNERENRNDYGITMDAVKQYLYTHNVPLSEEKFLRESYPTQYDITFVGDGSIEVVTEKYNELVDNISTHHHYIKSI